MVGPRHMLTVSHGISWNGDGSAGWVQFRPSYFSSDAPFGEARGIHWYRSAPDEWSGTNVSSGSAGAPRVAWPAELVGVAEPAMRRELARTPRGPVPCSRGLHAAGRHCNDGASSR